MIEKTKIDRKYRLVCPKCKKYNENGKTTIHKTRFGSLFCWNCEEFIHKNC